MMSDWFWDLATSSPVLGAIAAVALAAFVVAHVPFVRALPAVAPYAVAAGLVQVAAAALLMFLVGFRVSDERAETKQLKNDLAFTKLQIETAEETAKDAERLKAEAVQQAEAAKGELNEFRNKYGDTPEKVCAFTADDLVRLRALGRPKRRK